jgi:hypothetical protein
MTKDVSRVVSQDEETVDLNGFAAFEAEGDAVSGILLGSSMVVSEENKTYAQFILLSDEGIVRVNETAQLQILRHIPAGIPVTIVYQGKTGRMKLFSVRIPRAALPDVTRQAMRGMGAMPAAPAIDAADPFAD